MDRPSRRHPRGAVTARRPLPGRTAAVTGPADAALRTGTEGWTMTQTTRGTAPETGQSGLEEVILALEQVRTRTMGPELRLAMLRALKDRVGALVCDLLPTPEAGPGRGQPTDAACRADRLTNVWYGNLCHLLNELGHPRTAGQASFAVYREWVVRQLMRDLGCRVLAAARVGQAAPRGTWRTLHDLYFYLDGRDEVNGSGEPGRFSPGREYKRLLLAGVLGAEPEAPQLLAEVEQRLNGWAAHSTLRRDARIVGESTLLRLDLRACEKTSRPMRSAGVR